jgi:hypothetical protein
MPAVVLPAAHTIQSAPAPIGGLNARDAIAAMDVRDAIALVNWVPDTYGVRCRKGYREWATGLGTGEVQAIMPYYGPADTSPFSATLAAPTSMPGKLFAATKDNIYDITDSTNAPVSVHALSGSALAGWISSTMLSNAGGTFLLCASEDDGYFHYNGTTWTTPTLTGVSASALVHVAMWKRRAWFVEKNSTRAWYLAADSITGTAEKLDLGSVFKHGGHLSYIANWTIDAGEGIDDFIVFVGSAGDVAVYQGTDPADASTFGLVGTWYIGQVPTGRRGYTQYGGDLIVLSADGVTPISYVTRGGADVLVAAQKEYSSKIRPLLGKDMRSSFTERGWQMLITPTERLMVVSVPDYGSQRSRQYAMSTSMNQWTQFQDIPMLCLGSTGGFTFAGTRDGRVLMLFTGFFDAVPYGQSQGNGIRGVVQPAFSAFGSHAAQKQFLMVRPVFLSGDTPNALVDVNVNYDVATPTGTPTYAGLLATSPWDTALWDAAKWASLTQKTYAEWVSVSGVGFVGAATLITMTLADSTLLSIDYMLQQGGPL